MHPTSATSQIATNATVITLATHSIAGLSNSFPIMLVDSINPTFGKMNAHQLSANGIFPIQLTFARTAIAKIQNAKSHINTLTASATTLSVSLAVGCTAKYPYPSGIASASPINATIVYATLPTGINKPGRSCGGGSPLSSNNRTKYTTHTNEIMNPNPLNANPEKITNTARCGTCVPATKLAIVPVNIALYPARNMLGVNGTGRTLLQRINIQYCAMALIREKPAYSQYNTYTASMRKGYAGPCVIPYTWIPPMTTLMLSQKEPRKKDSEGWVSADLMWEG